MKVDGYFNSRNEPVIRLIFGAFSIEALVDTGFDGSLIIPSHFAKKLNLQFKGLEDLYSVPEKRLSLKLTQCRCRGLVRRGKWLL